MFLRIGGFLWLGLAAANAGGAGLLEAWTGQAPASWLSLDSLGLNAGGWATVGYTYNTDDPPNRDNSPVSFNYRADEFHLYQLNLFLERPTQKGAGWDWGGRFDFMFGTDTPYTQATGHWDDGLISERDLRFYDIALPQAYVEVFAPLGQGLTTKFGHFYSILGYESVASPPNFFSSHSYSMKSSPFTTTGALLSYTVDERWSLNLGAVTGADNFDRDLGAWSHMSGVTWSNPDTSTSLTVSVLQGDVYDTRSSELVYWSSYLQQSLGAWHYVLQHDRGAQRSVAGKAHAEWYSVVHYLTYDAAENLGVGLRGEWFRDDDGVRYAAGASSYYALTAGLNWKASGWFTLRPELRYDWAESRLSPYDGGHKPDQWLLGFDAVVQF